MIEKLLCPQCGGNDLQPFGSSAYKCASCGTVLKIEKEVEKEMPSTHYVAPLSNDFKDAYRSTDEFISSSEKADEEDFSPAKTILGILAVIVLGVILLCVKSCPDSPKSSSENITRLQDSMQQAELEKSIPKVPDFDVQATFTEKGITVDEVKIESNGMSALTKSMLRDSPLEIVLVKPKGWVRKGKKVYVGISISVQDKNGKELYAVADMNETASKDGEDFHKYSKELTISLLAAVNFGFTSSDNYVVAYRVWDKNSKNEITGMVPVFIYN